MIVEGVKSEGQSRDGFNPRCVERGLKESERGWV